MFCYSLKFLAEGNSLKEPQDRFGIRRILGSRARCPPLPYILSLMLRSRAHPKLSSEQSCDGSYSGVNDMNRRVFGFNLAVLAKDELPLSFDSDDCAYRFRCMDPSSRSQDGPMFDTNVWHHECGYDGVGLKQTVAIAKQFPASVSVKMTKNKKVFNLDLDSSVSIKHGENKSMAVFDIQPIGKQVAYFVRGETEYKDFKYNKTTIGMQVMFLGQKMVTGIKHARQITLGKLYLIIGTAGNVWFKSDFANEAKIEVQHHGQVQSTLGFSIKELKGNFVLALNMLAQFSARPNSKVSARAEINNKMNGQIMVKTNSSDHLPAERQPQSSGPKDVHVSAETTGEKSSGSLLDMDEGNTTNFCAEFHLPGHMPPLDFTLKTSMRVIASSSVTWFHRLMSCGMFNGLEESNCSAIQVSNAKTLYSWVYPQSSLPPPVIVALTLSSKGQGQMDCGVHCKSSPSRFCSKYLTQGVSVA